jgi:uncharacterized damage-inducible protein DinB
MPHPLVEQLRFTRSEFQRALKGVTDEEARRRFMPMNSISWIVGHLAAQEQRYWLTFGEGRKVVPSLTAYGYGRPASTPPLDEMWEAWHAVTQASDPYLDRQTSETLRLHPNNTAGKPVGESVGTLIRRVTYHYWYHTGESQAIRQMLGHTKLPTFVGDIGDKAPYRPEEQP